MRTAVRAALAWFLKYPEDEDIVNDAVLVLLELLEQGEPFESVKRQAGVVARNLRADHFRRQSLRKTDPLPPDVPARQADDAGRLAFDEALNQLPPLCREAVRCRFWEDMTQKEIAAHLNVSRDRVQASLNHAYARLAELLGDGSDESQELRHRNALSND